MTTRWFIWMVLSLSLLLPSCTLVVGNRLECDPDDDRCPPGSRCEGGECVAVDGDGDGDADADFDYDLDRDGDLDQVADGDLDTETDSDEDGGVTSCEEGRVRPCGSPLGICETGEQRCAGGVWGECEGGIEPGTEVCDEEFLDEDCDGDANEGCDCTEGATIECGTDEGRCEVGVQTCGDDGLWGDCEGSVGPTDEICNDEDDDCDGAIDEGDNACGGVCSLDNVAGVPCDGPDDDLCDDDAYICDGLNATVCSTGDDDVEICNDEDDDCDGTIDEGSNACGGICELEHAPGDACDGDDTDICTDDEYECDGLNSVVCPTGDDDVEICNDIDDDCDGTINEGENACGGACGLDHDPSESCDGDDTDLCTDDEYECDGLNATVCPRGDDNVEICNDVDDDCDGETDEGENACGGICELEHAPGDECDGSDSDLCIDDEYVCEGLNEIVCSTGDDDNACLIDGVCYDDEAVNPENECEICLTEIDIISWSPLPDFTPCTLATDPDRSYDICVSGACVSPGCGDASCNAPQPTGILPDTGQRACFNYEISYHCPDGAGEPRCPDLPFCGQDAQYGWDTTHNQYDRFVRTSDYWPIVTDYETGLIWQGCDAGLADLGCSSGTAEEMTWDEAISYCDSLRWGDFSDWRLPSYYEFLSGSFWGYAGADPYYFRGMNRANWSYWSSTSYHGTPGFAFLLETYRLRIRDITQEHRVFCVRGSADVSEHPRFRHLEAVDDQPIVIDNSTELTWQGCLAGLDGEVCLGGEVAEMDWMSALSFCEGLEWGSFNDWRLPNIIEIGSIMDTSQSNPSVDSSAFPETDERLHIWSSTSSPNFSFPEMASSVRLGTSMIDVSDKANLLAVRCVRFND